MGAKLFIKSHLIQRDGTAEAYRHAVHGSVEIIRRLCGSLKSADLKTAGFQIFLYSGKVGHRMLSLLSFPYSPVFPWRLLCQDRSQQADLLILGILRFHQRAGGGDAAHTVARKILDGRIGEERGALPCSLQLHTGERVGGAKV